MGMLVAIKPLHDQFQVKRIVVSTYQSVSGGVKKPLMSFLIKQSRFMLMKL